MQLFCPRKLFKYDPVYSVKASVKKLDFEDPLPM